ncbi:MAG TPA: hypothetical protein VKK31_15585 [Thermoanaerobaculia bacterium]|nr:hypothetical protein [Thermoanaerobaculia bacterium]
MRDQRSNFLVIVGVAVVAILVVAGHLWAAAPGTAAEPEVAVAKADLERLPGSYANGEMGFAFKVDLQEGRVRLTITQGPPFPPALLIPTSPTHFRWEGEGLAPGLAVSFQVTGSKATSLTVIQPGKPEVVMKRVG